MAAAFYEKLFSSEGSAQSERILALFAPIVTHDMNTKLLEAVSDDEIERALFQMGPMKSPGLDGFRPCFTNDTGRW